MGRNGKRNNNKNKIEINPESFYKPVKFRGSVENSDEVIVDKSDDVLNTSIDTQLTNGYSVVTKDRRKNKRNKTERSREDFCKPEILKTNVKYSDEVIVDKADEVSNLPNNPENSNELNCNNASKDNLELDETNGYSAVIKGRRKNIRNKTERSREDFYDPEKFKTNVKYSDEVIVDKSNEVSNLPNNSENNNEINCNNAPKDKSKDNLEPDETNESILLSNSGNSNSITSINSPQDKSDAKESVVLGTTTYSHSPQDKCEDKSDADQTNEPTLPNNFENINNINCSNSPRDKFAANIEETNENSNNITCSNSLQDKSKDNLEADQTNESILPSNLENSNNITPSNSSQNKSGVKDSVTLDKTNYSSSPQDNLETDKTNEFILPDNSENINSPQDKSEAEEDVESENYDYNKEFTHKSNLKKFKNKSCVPKDRKFYKKKNVKFDSQVTLRFYDKEAEASEVAKRCDIMTNLISSEIMRPSLVPINKRKSNGALRIIRNNEVTGNPNRHKWVKANKPWKN